MSIQIRRVLVCDGRDCPNVSLNVLATVDVNEGQIADWQGWSPVKVNMVDQGLAEAIRHLCPECVANGNTVEVTL